MSNKTPEADFNRFEKFIDGMENIEYEYWYNFEATSKQKELADKLREVYPDEYDYDKPRYSSNDLRALQEWLERND